MYSPPIGRIERVPLRDAFPHEAFDFTRWLEGNLDLLGDVLGLNLAFIEREHAAGDFSVDLVAQDASGNLVVIENQLERSNHDHLGKVITYVAMVGAKRAIWIVSEPRPEHLKAVQWLNEGGNASFHLLKLEAIRIGDSAPAPFFTVITGPSDATAEAGRVKRDQEAASNRYVEFWQALLQYSRTKTQLHKNISPGTSNWISTSADMPAGFSLGYVLARGKGRVELYIDEPSKGKAYTEALFHALESSRSIIEAAYGGPLSWEELPEGRACRVCHRLDLTVSLENADTWQAFIESMVDSMIRLDQATRPYLSIAVTVAAESPVLEEPAEENAII